MKKLFNLILFCMTAVAVNAQTAAVPGVEPYGKVSQADLDLKKCDFEPDANAEVLFDKGDAKVTYLQKMQHSVPVIEMHRHIRIKVFNDFGKNYGNVSIRYYSYMDGVVVNDLQAQTINVADGKTEITPLDKKLIYIEKLDSRYSALKFAFQNIKPGSILEYKYTVTSPAFPTWYFQNYMPVRYSEVDVNIPGYVNFKSVPHVRQDFVKSTGLATDAYQVRVLTNVHSMPDEPYMGSREDNLQRIEFLGIDTYVSTWPKIGEVLMHFDDFGADLDKNLSGESGIIGAAKKMNTPDEKIAYIFDTVKNRMKWNDRLQFFTNDGPARAWDKQSGNSAEINMMVFHLLKKAGIKAYPVVVCTKSNGKINPANPNIYLFNNVIVYVPIDSTKNYILDATNRHGLCTSMPENILNTFGLNIDAHDALSINYSDNQKAYNMIFVADDQPAMQSIYLNAEIKPDGKMEGDAEITSSKYNKVHALQLYDIKGPDKYLDTFKNFDNNLKILSFKRENASVDSLPLTQKVNFSMDLTGSDSNYIYFSTPSFNLFGKNPFLSEQRFSDVDFGYLNNYSVYCVYKLPAGYKTDALPKPLTLLMPDKSIILKRTVAEGDGTILIKYVIIRNKSFYFKEDYPDLREFYKKMYELLGEQVVLKKA